MRLINCATLKFEEFIGKHIPEYLILSHTWETYEISYKDYCAIDDLRSKPGPQAEKILKTCDIAASLGYRYVWIDSCCIDKSSSAELTEAINSMFKWYREAGLCIVYLSDYDGRDPEATLGKCRWFTRGWTLQELIAPSQVLFYDTQWRYSFNKIGMFSLIASITGIGSDMLSTKRSRPDDYSIAERMSWAAHRETTREEDIAYCLFGIFNVNLPLLYGEGPRAFMRLQEIVKNNTDLSIFAWQAQLGDGSPDMTTSMTLGLRGIFAHSPCEFALAKGILTYPHTIEEFSVTNRGLRIETPLFKQDHDLRGWPEFPKWVMPLNCYFAGGEETTAPCISIWIAKIGANYRRVAADRLAYVERHALVEQPAQLVYIAKSLYRHG